MARELEAPDRFRAIQTHRATLAVLRRQLTTIEHLHEYGMIDDTEVGIMLKPVAANERRMLSKGPRAEVCVCVVVWACVRCCIKQTTNTPHDGGDGGVCGGDDNNSAIPTIMKRTTTNNIPTAISNTITACDNTTLHAPTGPPYQERAQVAAFSAQHPQRPTSGAPPPWPAGRISLSSHHCTARASGPHVCGGAGARADLLPHAGAAKGEKKGDNCVVIWVVGCCCDWVAAGGYCWGPKA